MSDYLKVNSASPADVAEQRVLGIRGERDCAFKTWYDDSWRWFGIELVLCATILPLIFYFIPEAIYTYCQNSKIGNFNDLTGRCVQATADANSAGGQIQAKMQVKQQAERTLVGRVINLAVRLNTDEARECLEAAQRLLDARLKANHIQEGMPRETFFSIAREFDEGCWASSWRRSAASLDLTAQRATELGYYSSKDEARKGMLKEYIKRHLPCDKLIETVVKSGKAVKKVREMEPIQSANGSNLRSMNRMLADYGNAITNVGNAEARFFRDLFAIRIELDAPEVFEIAREALAAKMQTRGPKDAEFLEGVIRAFSQGINEAAVRDLIHRFPVKRALHPSALEALVKNGHYPSAEAAREAVLEVNLHCHIERQEKILEHVLHQYSNATESNRSEHEQCILNAVLTQMKSIIPEQRDALVKAAKDQIQEHLNGDGVSEEIIARILESIGLSALV